MKTTYKLRVIVAFCFRILCVYFHVVKEFVTDSLQGDRLLDPASYRAHQVHGPCSTLTLRHCNDAYLAPNPAGMVANLNYDPQLEGFPTITVRQLGRSRLGLHCQGIWKRHFRNEEHGLFFKTYGFDNRHGGWRGDRHGQKVRCASPDSASWRKEFSRKRWKSGHDHSKGHDLDGGAIVRAVNKRFIPTNRGTYATSRILPSTLSRLCRAISFGQVGDGWWPHPQRSTAAHFRHVKKEIILASNATDMSEPLNWILLDCPAVSLQRPILRMYTLICSHIAP